MGVSVVNALSKRLVLEIDRNEKHYVAEFVNGGNRKKALKVTGNAPRGGTGTTVTFWPDPKVFDETEFRAQTVLERLQVMAFLNRGLEIRFTDERPGVSRRSRSVHRRDRRLRQAPQCGQGVVVQEGLLLHPVRGDQEVEIALQWNTGFHEYDPLLRQRHLHRRGRHARRGLQEGPHQRR